MKKNNYALPHWHPSSAFSSCAGQSAVTCCLPWSGNWWNLRTECVRSLFYRNSVLAETYLPDTDRHVYETFDYKSQESYSACCWQLSEVIVFQTAILKNTGVIQYFLYYCHRNVFLETAANPYVTALGDRDTAPAASTWHNHSTGWALLSLAVCFSVNWYWVATTILHLPTDRLPGRMGCLYQFGNGFDETNRISYCTTLNNNSGCLHRFQTSQNTRRRTFGRKRQEPKINRLTYWNVHIFFGVIAQFFYNGEEPNGYQHSCFPECTVVVMRLSESVATTFFDAVWPRLRFSFGRWIGTLLMVKFRPQDMLLVYALLNMVLCGVIAMRRNSRTMHLAVSFFICRSCIRRHNSRWH